jgi:hypothetical protein
METLRFDNPPLVAPHDACVCCLRGDTTTGLAFEGCAEWCIAGLINLGIPDDEATHMVERGIDDGTVDTTARDIYVYPCRVCPTCATRNTSLPVAEVKSGTIPKIVQPEVAG